jgi:ribonuclease HI
MKKEQLSIFNQEDTLIKTETKNASMSKHFVLYIDGASRGNPGPAGAGVYIMQNKKKILNTNGFLGIKTNNQAEYLALALGLFHIQKLCSSSEQINLTIRSDSQLLIRQMNGEYAIKNPFIKALVPCISKLKLGLQTAFEHIPRELNSHADAEANKGIDEKTALPAPFKKLLTL